VVVSLDAKASFRRVAPGETNLRNAEQIALTDIQAGDRVLALGNAHRPVLHQRGRTVRRRPGIHQSSATGSGSMYLTADQDQKSLVATLMIVMSRADLANKQAGERYPFDSNHGSILARRSA
jgi:hypothetical protein